jgi:hypothetical protein
LVAILEAMLLIRGNQPKCDILFDSLKEKVAFLYNMELQIQCLVELKMDQKDGLN